MTDGGYYEWLRYWPYAVLMIAVASWALYHFLAPESWRDWAGAGLVEAFVIALYAEMYGFPLTIYLLTSVLGVEIPLVHYSGHLWATLLGYGPIGAVIEMSAGFALLFAGILLVARGWVRIYLARRGGDDGLVTEGVYSIMRHPQYAGIVLIIVGQLVHWPTLPTLALAPFILWAYLLLAKREEALLAQRFGDAHREYRRRVPMFFPRLDRSRARFEPQL